MEINSIILRLR